MEDTSHVSPLRRWLESILVWYILFMIVYLLARFVVQTEWRFIALVNNAAPYLFLLVLFGLLIAVLLRSRRLIGIYLLVSLVGVLWVGMAVAPALPRSSITGTEVRIASFNVFPDNPTISEAVEWIDSYQPDIIALQELPDDQSAFAPFEQDFAYSALADTPTVGRVFSQYPITSSETVDLLGWQIQRLILNIEGTDVVVYNVHLIMPLNDREVDWLILRYDESRRNAQLEQLVNLIAAETLPVILVGDLNMTEWSPAYHLLTRELRDAYRMSSWGVGATFPASEGEELGGAYPRLFRLDYVWYSDPIVANSAFVGANLGSDHLPLIVELTIP